MVVAEKSRKSIEIKWSLTIILISINKTKRNTKSILTIRIFKQNRQEHYTHGLLNDYSTPSHSE